MLPVMELTAENLQAILKRLADLEQENRLLKQKVAFLMKRLFGRSSEKLSSDQLLFLLGDDSVPPPDEDPEPDPQPPKSRPKRERRTEPRLSKDLPTEHIVVDPDEVKQDPSAYECIGEETIEELDVVPHRYVRRLIHRRKFKRKDDRSQAPVIAPQVPRLLTGSLLSPGLATEIVLGKYMDHLPLYRQAEMFRRQGIDLSRQMLCNWVGVTAHWLRLIYEQIGRELRMSGYLQIDETPVMYARGEDGCHHEGYFWARARVAIATAEMLKGHAVS